MRAAVPSLLADAAASRTAVVAVNIYTLDQAAGVVDGAIRADAPVILQVHPGGVGDLLASMLAGINKIRDDAPIRVATQLDHTADGALIDLAIEAGVDAIMVDGSALPFAENLRLVADVRDRLPARVALEAELGRLAGSEDGSVAPTGALTDPAEVADFAAATGIHALAVSVGNIHGVTRVPVSLDLDRLAAIRAATPLPLVLHGASGLPDSIVRAAIAVGVAKVNMNTDVRRAYRDALCDGDGELTHVLAAARAAVADFVEGRIRSWVSLAQP